MMMAGEACSLAGTRKTADTRASGQLRSGVIACPSTLYASSPAVRSLVIYPITLVAKSVLHLLTC
jgi:hypothetical protein